jgi:linoleoyl-CoA desaturase
MANIITFDKTADLEFSRVLKRRVNEYFARTGLSRHHTPSMVIKTVLMLLLYILPFIFILTGLFPVWFNMLLYVVMGIGLAGIGMSVMHDGNHYGYSKSPRVNRLMGDTVFLLGADAYNWKIKHNKLHHVYTNVFGSDEDINSRVILRFAYAAPLKRYHRYQHIYAWFLYALMSLSMIFGDVRKRLDYRARGITNISAKAFNRSMFWLLVYKVLYFGAIFGLPLLLTNMAWWQVIGGFLLMHITAGVIMSLIFQMAHVVEGPGQALPDDEGNMNRSMIMHQFRSTADFSRNNKLITWYVGGLNFQVEHHLFPRVCHVHYPAISKIVETTTKEFGVPFYVYDRFWDAFRSHFRVLKELGRITEGAEKM